jgi:hypothetical protein
MAPADDPASAAPRRQAAAMARQTGLSRRTSTTSPGSPPVRVEKAAPLGQLHVRRRCGVRSLQHPQLNDVQPEALEPLLGGRDGEVGPLARGRRRDHVGRTPSAVLDEQAVVRFVARLELVAPDQRQQTRRQVSVA